jgi:ribonuclease HI
LEAKDLKEVIIYTDGGSDPNPGKGGYGVVLMHGKHRKEISGGFRLTTNNRMELYAVIMALRALKEPCKVKLYSDSEYVVNAMTKGWVQNWIKKGWKKVKNPDLWQQLVELTKKHDVEFNWVKGHAGILENERCDELAAKAGKSADLPADAVFESNLLLGERGVNDDQLFSKKSKPEKIVSEGQPCNKCSVKVIKKNRPENKPIRKGSSYYYQYYFICPGCGTIYYPEEGKVFVK